MLLSIDQKGIVNRMLTLAVGLTILAKKVKSQQMDGYSDGCELLVKGCVVC